MGPTTIGNGNYLDVDQHPHIGLCTLTHLLEGAIEHRDSTGVVQRINPSDVGFMTAGKGVAHTERTPQNLRDGELQILHGYQVWVALPKEKEEMEPTFSFIPKEENPKWRENHLDITLVAGSGFGKKAPLEVHSHLFMVDIKATENGILDIKGQLEGEIAVVVTKGQVAVGQDVIAQGQMLVSKTEDTCQLNLEQGTRLLLFGGTPLPEERFMYWNFVSSSRDRLEQAKKDWAERKFPKVPGDKTYIPLP